MYVCFPLLIFRSEMFPSLRRYHLTTICSLECIRYYSNFFVFSLGIYGSDVNNRAIDHRVLKMQHRWCIWPLWTISFIKCLTRKVLGGFFSLSSSSFFCQKSIFSMKFTDSTDSDCNSWDSALQWGVSSPLADRLTGFGGFHLYLFPFNFPFTYILN